MLTRSSSRFSTQGGILAIAVITCAVLTVLGATSYMAVQNRFRLAHQTARWQEAMLPAEAGIDMAVNEVRKQLYMADLSKDFFPDSFDLDGDGQSDGGWEKGEPLVDDDDSGTYDEGESYKDLNENGKYDSELYHCNVALSGDPNHQVAFTVFAEPLDPVGMGLTPDAERYWRIRSMGAVTLPPAAAKVTTTHSEGKVADTLRKFEFLTNRRTGATLETPQATRVVEAILKPLSTFRLALFGTSAIDMNNHNIVVDSYDSRSSAKSTYNPLLPHLPGQYIPTKRQQNGDIATNGPLIDAGGAQIYGDAATNGGTVLNSQNVKGDISSDFYQEVFPVNTPKTADGLSDIAPDPGTPSSINNAAIIEAKELTAEDRNVAQFRFDRINLSGQSTLTIRGKTDTAGKPIPTYAQIVVTGDINVSGQGQIILDPGVYVRIFLMGNADITGNGFANPNTPLNLQLYGVDNYRRNSAGEILKDAAGKPIIDYGTMKIAGNGGFMGAVYAPHYNLEIKGGGNSDTVFGAFVANHIFMNGVTSVHYDEALGDGGLVGEYKVVSWFEDIR